MKIRLVKFLCICILAANNSYADRATQITIDKNKQASIPVDESREFINSRKGLIYSESSSAYQLNKSIPGFEFESGVNPGEVNPSLWQHAKLNNIRGLFKVTDSIYQLRGYDISNMSVIEGKHGIIIIDPLTAVEAAKNALQAYYEYRPYKPVTAVIYTHSHIDHFGGVKGIISDQKSDANKIQIIAPKDFMQSAISENIFAGNAMSRRSYYMYGLNLKSSPYAFIDEGLGKEFVKNGTTTLIEPTKEILKTGEKLEIDGIIFVFQLTPDTEAPSEMNIYFPQFRALDMAENSSKTLHNFYTLRGAQIRDSKSWAKYLNEAINKFGNKLDVMFTQHNWPTWGNKQIIEQLSNQRDEILYIHDQTLHLANMGYTPNEIAESIKLPPELYKYGYERGYYGTVKHNAKAVYQKYLGNFDGNPVNLDPLPEQDAAKKYVEYMGGSNLIIKKAKKDYAAGNYRWVATVMSYIVFADPANKEARNLEANALEQLGYQAEAATWRNEYLVAASELRGEAGTITAVTASPDIVSAMTITQFFDNLSIHLNPDKAKNIKIVGNWIFPDSGQRYITTLNNSVFRYESGTAKNANFTVKLDKSTLAEILMGKKNLSKKVDLTGDKTGFKSMLTYFDDFDPAFNIVEP